MFNQLLLVAIMTFPQMNKSNPTRLLPSQRLGHWAWPRWGNRVTGYVSGFYGLPRTFSQGDGKTEVLPTSFYGFDVPSWCNPGSKCDTSNRIPSPWQIPGNPHHKNDPSSGVVPAWSTPSPNWSAPNSTPKPSTPSPVWSTPNSTGSPEDATPSSDANPGHPYEHHQNEHFLGWIYEHTHNDLAGPHEWAKVSEFCQGDYQSPINLDTHTAVGNGTVGDIVFEKYDWVNRNNWLLENNGHSLEMELISLPVGAAIMSGGPLSKSYRLLQFHFHWGSTDSAGSEHTMDNRTFPLEMHMVHLATDIEWGVGSATSPRNVPDGLAVAAFLFEVSNEENKDLRPIIDQLHEVRVQNSSAQLVNDDFNVASLIHHAIYGPYFSYRGSLTTPTCNEVVHWINFKNTLKLSHSQLAEFRLLLNIEGKPLKDNYRHTHPLNNRLVTLTNHEPGIFVKGIGEIHEN